MRLRRIRKEIALAIAGMTEYPVAFAIGPVLRQRTAEYSHFLRVQHRTRFVEVGLTPADMDLPVEELIEQHVRLAIDKLVASINPGMAA